MKPGAAGERIAVVGIGCRLPGADDHRKFSANLLAGHNAIREITPDRWDPGRYYSSDPAAPNRSVSRWCGLIDDPYAFDHAFFRMSPREALLTDPQQRLLLQESWRCVEDSGSALDELRRLRTAVFVGVMGRDHLQQVSAPETPVQSHSAVGAYDGLLANRVSHALGLRGPSLSIDAACASSLVAVQLGMRALLAGDADVVLAGGVSLNLHPWKYISFSKARMLSPRGLCRTFDRGADGYVPGDGVAMVMLRRLEDALADGDHVYGTVASAVVNHGGTRQTITAPTIASQRAVIRAAMDEAGFDPRSVTYVEAHGTGTSLGDPIEVEALRQAFDATADDGPWCTIGSVKPNVGHLEAAAGMAGLIKVLMMMGARRIPPSIHLDVLNPLIPLDGGPFEITTAQRPWRPAARSAPLRAGVSSFGMGGVNAHACVEEYRPPRRRTGGGSSLRQSRLPFLLSAKTPAALDRLIRRWQVHPMPTARHELASVCRTLATGRQQFDVRVGTLAGSADDIAQFLATVAAPAGAGDVRPPWLLRVGGTAAPSAARLRALLSSGPFASWLTEDTDGPAVREAIRELTAAGRQGAARSLFTYLTLRVLGMLGIRPQELTAAGEGLLPALAYAGAIRPADLRAAEGGPLPDLRAPDIPVVGPGGALLRAHCLDETYLRRVVEAADPHPDDLATSLAGAADLVVAQYTYRHNLADWDTALRESGLDRLRVPLSAEPIRGLDLSDRLDRLVWLLATNHARDRLHRKWGLPRAQTTRGPAECELLDLLLDDVCRPAELLAVMFGTGPEVETAVRAVQERAADGPADRHRYPMLAAHSDEAACAARPWLESLRRPDAALPPVSPARRVLDIFVDPAGQGRPTGAAVAIDGVDELADDAAGPLLELWRLGVGIDWTRYWSGRPGHKVALPTYDFEPIVHRAEVDPRPVSPPAEPALRPAVELVELMPSWGDAGPGPAPRALGATVVVAAGPVDAAVLAAARTGLHPTAVTVVALDEGAAADDWIRPGDAGDVEHLLDRLAGPGGQPAAFVFVAAYAGGASGAEVAMSVVETAFLVAQALLRRRAAARLITLCAGPSAPEMSALAGLATCVRREGTLSLTAVDTDSSISDPATWRQVGSELSVPEPAAEVRYEGHRRQVRWWRPAPLAEPDNPPAAAVRAGGTYLVTGGAGGLGRLLAGHLLRTAGTRVVLAGRSAEPPGLLAGLRQQGGADLSRLAYLQADLADRGDTDALIARIHERFGELTGVFHAAGVVRDRYLVGKSLDDIRSVLAPKIHGTRNLDAATAGDPLDFFVLFSSVVAVIGNPGQTDYAVGNAFLSAFADHREALRSAGQRQGRCLAIDWPLWSNGGMRVGDSTATVFRAEHGLVPMPTDIGIRALDETLAAGRGRTLLYGDPARIAAFLAPAASRGEVVPATAAATSIDDALAYLKSVCASLLDVPEQELDEDTGLDQYGIDSIFITQFTARLDQDLGPVSHTMLFECRTLSEVAARVAARHPEAVRVAAQAPASPSAATPASPAGNQFAVAVIGLAGRYPDADDIGEFWRNLREGRSSISAIPASRWDPREHTDDMYCRWGGFLDGVDRFDPLFFQISPREAELIDPQERLFLQTAWHTFEDAGYPPHRLGSPDHHGERSVGVFVGITTQTYLLWGPDEHRAGRPGIPTSTPWSIANRVSYVLNLHGPSMPVDTACASSLSAVHLAFESLSRGECRMALVGGVNLYLHPSKYEWLCQMQMLSPTGRCHAFGDAADGFVPGEGVGAVLLKPLRDALADGDRVYGVIRGTAVNHGGRTSGFTVPNPNAQVGLIADALRVAGFEPDTVSHVEAHGTGTSLGDPIEITGLTRSYGAAAEGGVPCAVGSVKTNIGHLESAAGIAGLTKVLLQMRHRTLVPSLNAERINPRIEVCGTRLRIQRETAPWEPIAADGSRLPLRAGISSFGAGGANAHILVEEAPAAAVGDGPEPGASAPGRTHLVPVSAHDPDRLREHCANLARHLRDLPDLDLADVAYQLQVRREPLRERVVFLVNGMPELVAALGAVAEESPAEPAGWTTARGRAARPAAAKSLALTVAEAITARDLRSLADAWVSGASVAWHELHQGARPHVDLPGYPFARERHWLPDTPAAAGGAGHPFVGSVIEQGSRFATVFTGAEPFLADHRVDGVPIFPAVGYLEMVRAALDGQPRDDAAAPGLPLVFRTNVWSHAVTVPGPTTVCLDLTRTGDTVSYRVHGDDGGEPVVHAEGRVAWAAGPERLPVVDMAAARRRCPTPVEPAAFYRRIHQLGLQLGPGYQGISGLRVGPDEAVSEIHLPDAGDHRFLLHPSLFDSALQATLWLIAERAGGVPLHLPYMIGSVEVFRPTPVRGTAHVTIRTWTDAAKKAEVTLLDAAGEPVLVVRDFWLRPWQSIGDSPGAAPAVSAVPAVFFRPRWEPARPTTPRSVVDGQLVIIAPDPAAGRRLADAVAGLDTQPPMVVAPDAGRDVAALLDSLPPAPLTMVYAGAQRFFDGTVDGFENQLGDGLFPVFRLVRAILADPAGRTVRLLCVYPGTAGGQPGYAALAGFLRTACRECRRLSYRLVERPGTDRDDAVVLRTELTQPWTADREVRYRHGARQVLRWRRSPIATAVPTRRHRPIHLVTGGLGGLGRLIAAHLARTTGARLLLVGRRPADERMAATLAEIVRSGGEARYVPADVATAEGAARAVQAALTAYGSLDAVVHCAGVLADDYLVRLDETRLRTALASKVYGALHLDAATRHLEMERFVLFSSIAGAVGTVGQANYAYANAFLDGFAEWRESQVAGGARNGTTTSIGWPLWCDGGMHVEAEVEDGLAAMFGIRPLATDVGLAAFDAAMAGPAGAVLVVPGDGDMMQRRLDGTGGESGGEPAGTGIDLAQAVSAAVTEQVGAVAKLDPVRIDPTADIGSYGFDSLAFNRLSNALNAELGVEVTPATFFEHTTVAALVDHLQEAFPEAVRALAERAAPAAPTSAIGRTPHAARASPTAALTETAFMPGAVPAGASGPGTREPIAIIGMAGMLPGSADLDEFWAHLVAGDDVVTEIPADRWDWRRYYGDPHSGPNLTNSKWGGFLPEVDTFDARFFGISPREAELMDPQQRLFLETVYRAIEEAGYQPADLAAGRTGLYVGVATHDYHELLREAGVPTEAYSTTGLFHAILANRVSYLLNLTGPSFPIDTACSSSLVAVRSAIEAIWSGSCDVAIAGGVNLLLAPMIYISFAKAGMLSPTGRCKTFDASADGYVRGEGAGAILLKPLSRAIADRDHIHAVIRGSAINHGGKVNTLTTPNPNAQAELIVRAFQESEVDPATVGYIEMHGTGTALGDPIEINGLQRAYRDLRDRAGRPRLTTPTTVVGSVKSNIGHLEAAAGMAGILKVLLAMRHGVIPGNLHITEVNPHLRLAGGPLRLARATEPWPRPRDAGGRDLPRRAGVSSFGFGGVNGHVLIEEYPASPRTPSQPGEPQVFVLSARTGERLTAYARLIADHLRSRTGAATGAPDGSRLRAVVAELLAVDAADVPTDESFDDLGLGAAHLAQLRVAVPELAREIHPGHTIDSLRVALAGPAGDDEALDPADVAYTLQVGREAMPYRLAVVAGSMDRLVAVLDEYASTGGRVAGAFAGTVDGDLRPPAAVSDDPADLARAWVSGAAVDWGARAAGRARRRVSLPTYPFARTRYWVPEHRGSGPAVAGQDVRANGTGPTGSTADDPRRRRIDPTDPLVAGHAVDGILVLPGVGHLEVVRAALARDGGPFRFHRVVWTRPLTVGPGGRDVEVVTSGDAGFRVVTADGTAYTQGWFESADAGGLTPVDLDDVRRRCTRVLTADQIYRRFHRIAIDYGPAFRTIERAWIGHKEALARISTGAGTARSGTLHTGLTDAALQLITVLDFGGDEAVTTTRLPFSVESVECVEPLTATGYAHVRVRGDDAYDVSLLGDDGRVHLVFRDVTVRAQGSQTALAYRPQWVPEPVPVAAAPMPSGEALVVHAGGAFGVPRAIRERHTRIGAPIPWVLRLGARTRRVDERTWDIDPADQAAIATCLAELGAVREVWFLTGLCAAPDDIAEGRVTDRAGPGQLPGGDGSGQVLTLYRLVRALVDADRIQSLAALRVVVNDVHDVDGRRVGNPASGGLVGFARSLAKEYPHVDVTCVDVAVPGAARLSSAEAAELTEAVAAEPAHRDNQDVVLAGGHRWRRVLRPLAPGRSATVLRRHGVYVIVGGTGGIGRTLARHLAETYQARVVLLGRRPETPDVTAELRHLGELGGQAVYHRADIADRDATAAALRSASDRFGGVHGVVHAAMVLHDGLVERLDESAVQAVLRPKLGGSLVLAELLADAPLDFVLFLSSVQSFTGSTGQGNYAAASTGQDAIARWLAGRARYPVKIVNWGYWGTVGGVATDHHRRSVRTRGYGSLSPADGIAAVEQLLAGDEQQVIVIRAEPPVLASIGVRPEPDRPAAPVASAIPPLSVAEAEQQAFDDYLVRSVLGALRRLGLFRQPGDRVPERDLLTRTGCLPRHGRLMSALVDLLRRAGMVTASGGGLVTGAAAAVDTDPRTLDELAGKLRRNYPDLLARLNLAQTCLHHLPDVLTGERSGTETLFPGGSADLVAAVYRGDPLTDYCNALVAEQVAVHLRQRGPQGARLIEIGAGTGGTTHAVLGALRPLGPDPEYHYTDVSARLVRAAERAFAGAFAGLRFREFDVEGDLASQGFAAHTYDVVLAANVLHATRDLDSALATVHTLLLPGGRLVLTEVTRVLPFHTVTFGLLDGWWHVVDEHRRLSGSPLLDEGMWRTRLERAGFTDVTVLGEPADRGRLTQRVTVATAIGAGSPPIQPAQPFEAVREEEAASSPAVHPSRAMTPSSGPVPAPDAAQRHRLTELIATTTAEALGMRVDEVDPRVALASIGVDSIVGVELINSLNTALGIVLKTIVIFDHPTVTDLAGFILERYPDALAPSPVEPSPVPQPVPPSLAPAASEGFLAVRFDRPGDPRDLRIVPIEAREPGLGEIEILVRAFPVNFSDFLVAKGLYPMMPDFPLTPGVEVSGVVRRAGPGVTRLAPGDEVIALTRPEMGGQASIVVTDENFAVRKPSTIGHAEACGFPVAFLAMYLACERAAVRPGDVVLIPAATGTNGLVAVQLVRQFGGEVIATAGSAHKVAFLGDIGVRESIDHSEADIRAEVLARTGGRGVDVVINTRGGEALQTGLDLLAPDGRYVEFAVFGLQSAHSVDLSRLVDNQSIHSFNTKKFFVNHPERRLPYLEKMAEYLAAGTVRPHLARTFPFDQVAAAYAAKADRSTIGRVVVELPEQPPNRPQRTTVASVSPIAGQPCTGAANPAHEPRPARVDTDIAVIGMSGRFPGASNVDEFWANLAAGRSSVTEIPRERWSAARFHDPDPTRRDTSYCKHGGFLADVDRFDAAFFNISGKEAAQTDPQQRLFLEESWRAIEDAGQCPETLGGRRCGVFVGVGSSEYLTRMNKAGVVKEAQSFWGNEASILAARISYLLNLRGPSVAVNTACSSSLVALHLACQSILTGESELAMAGGVFLTLAPDYLIVASNGNMLAPDGRCKTFDASADGFGPGEAVAAVLLKPLAAALADGDPIHGVIKSTAINQDGKTNGITAPSGLAQTEVELAAYERAGISPETITYLEAHGTGTRLGDPIEVEALTNAFARHTSRRQFCAIGSVKTNIGHTAAAAGIVGLVKVLLSMRHRQLPPTLNFREANPMINFADSPFYVNTELRPWHTPDGRPMRAAVSSFGFSGTNAHVVVEQAPTRPRPAAPTPRGPLLFPVSARSAPALRAKIGQLVDWLDGAPAVTAEEVAYHLQRYRDHLPIRTAFVAADLAGLAERLRAAYAGDGRAAEEAAADRHVARFLAGDDLAWESLWQGAPGPRLRLPTYPFDRTRHWYAENDTVYADGSAAGTGAAATCTDRAAGTPAQAVDVGAADVLQLTGAEWYLRDHQVDGRPVLPAAVGIALATAAARRIGIAQPAIRDLHWLRPVDLPSGVGGATLSLRSETAPAGSGGDGVAWQLRSAGPDQVIYARGVLAQPASGDERHRVDLPELVRACPRPVSVPELYARLRATGLAHGPALAAVQELRLGDAQALVRLRIPPSAGSVPGGDGPHPALVDGALQAVAAFVEPDVDGGMLPVAVREVRVWGPLPRECVAVLLATGNSAGTRTFDIRLVDEAGRPIVALLELVIRTADRSAAHGGESPDRATATSGRPEDRLRDILERLSAGEIDEDQAELAMEAVVSG